MSVTRRSFLKIAGATTGIAATAAVAPRIHRALNTFPEHDPQTDGDRVVPTFCEICFWKCGVLAHVRDGTITKIVGNPDHPLSRGRLCPRGTGGIGAVYDPDRLTRPLIRRERRGEQSFEEVSWESALDRVAEGLTQIKQRFGPEAVAVYTHGYGGSWFRHLMMGYGTRSFGQPSHAQCRGARDAGFELTFGAPAGSPEVTDLERSRVITLIGSHIGENMHNTQVQWFANALGNGAQLIVVDPRFSTAAGKATHWLPIRPGTDIALLLAWIHVIIEEQRYDRDYIDRYAIGLDELREHVRDKTPQWAAVRTGLDAQAIVDTARLMAGARPASLVHPGRHVSWYGDDTQRARAIAILNALLGSWGRRGGFYFPAQAPIPPYPGLPPYPEARPSADTPNDRVFPVSGVHGLAHGLRDASLPGAEERFPYAIKGWLVYGSNLVQSLPQPERTIEALQALDFVVSVDVLPAEITGWSDVVLPESTYLERYDDIDNSAFREPYLALRQPVVEPMHDSKPGWWIARELGLRLGLERYFPWENVEEYLDARLSGAGTSLRELSETGVREGPAQPIFIEDGVEPTFHTPSGKIELRSGLLAEAGLDPMPNFTAHEMPGADQFRLLFGRAPTHTFGRTTNNRFLSEIFDENVVWLNAARATELGFSSGDEVYLVNQDDVRVGPIKVRATEAIRPDCVYMVHGYGHSDPRLRFAHGRGVDDNKLCTKVAIDPVMGGTGMNVNFVRLEREQGTA